MDKFIQILNFAKLIFDDDKSATKADQIMEGILQAQSPRISDIADAMPGKEAGNTRKCSVF
jgi:hypothetical protein